MEAAALTKSPALTTSGPILFIRCIPGGHLLRASQYKCATENRHSAQPQMPACRRPQIRRQKAQNIRARWNQERLPRRSDRYLD